MKIVIYTLFFFISCIEKGGVSDSDMYKYPWLSKFIISPRSKIRGIFDLDTGEMNFSYTVMGDYTLFRSKIDSAIYNEKWEIIRYSKNEIFIEKRIKIYVDGYETIKMYIRMNEKDHDVLFFID